AVSLLCGLSWQSLPPVLASVTLWYTPSCSVIVFFFTDPAPTEIYTLSLHDALPICSLSPGSLSRTPPPGAGARRPTRCSAPHRSDRKSTRLNSSHVSISYAVFCLKKKNGDDVGLDFLRLHHELPCFAAPASPYPRQR